MPLAERGPETSRDVDQFCQERGIKTAKLDRLIAAADEARVEWFNAVQAIEQHLGVDLDDIGIQDNQVGGFSADQLIEKAMRYATRVDNFFPEED